MKYKLALVMSVLCAFSAWTEAKVKLPAILSDGMVLQRERPVKIWGNADKGENVTVVFKKKKFSTVAGEDGKWLVELPPMKAGGPFEMTVNDIRLKDILVGDVWLCSGQSNMELTAGRVTDKFAEEIARDENPMIRYVKIPLGNDLHGPKDDLSGKTLAAASSLGMTEKMPKKEQAAKVGELIAKKAQEAGITTVVFDRNGYLYHGRVKEVADAARNGGLKF